MGFILQAAKSKTAAGVGLGVRGLLGGGGRRMVTGAVAGGLYGGLSSDKNTDTGVFRQAMFGAAMGLGVGALTTKTVMKGAWGATKFAGKKTPGLLMNTAKLGIKAGRFGLRNPKTALLLGGAGYGAYALAGSGGGSFSGSVGDMSTIAQMNNISSTGFNPGMGTNTRQAANQNWMASTVGLTQGLHRGRH